MANRISALDAAKEYLLLEGCDLGAAIRFAHEYEATASSEDFDAYLEFLDRAYANADAA